MSQTFKKKTLVVALAATLASGVVIPTIASANQFADTSVINTNSNSVNVQAKAAQSPGNTITFTEAVLGSIGTGAAGELVFALDNGGRFTGVNVKTTAGGGFTVTAPSAVVALPGAVVQNTYHPLFTFKFNGQYYCVKVMDTAGTTITTASSKVFYTTGTDAAAAISATNYSTGTAPAGAPTSQAQLATAIIAELNRISTAAGVAALAAANGSSTGLVFADTATSSAGAASAAGTSFDVITDLAAVASTVTNSLGTNVTPAAGYPTINASGQLVLRMTAQSSAVGSIALANMLIDASASTTGTPINVTLTGTGTGANGVSNTSRVANVSAGALTSALSSGSPLGATNSSLFSIPSFTVTERFAGDAAVAVASTDPVAAKVLQFKLSSNAKFTAFSISSGNTADKLGYQVATVTSGTATTAATTFLAMKRDGSVVQVTVPVVSGTGAADLTNAYSAALQANGFVPTTDFTTSNTAVTFVAGRGAFASSTAGGGTGNAPTFGTEYGYGISDAGVVSVPVVVASDAAATYTVTNAVAALTTTDTGALTVTTSTNALTSNALTVGTISQATAGAGTTSLVFNDVAPVGLATVYTGRANNTVFNTGDALRLSESVKAQIPSGSLVTLSLNVGNYVTAPAFAAIGSAPTLSSSVQTTGGIARVATTGVSASATATDYVKIDSFTVDLSKVTTAGDLTVALGGNPSITSTAAVKVASIVDATTTSISGTLPTAATGSLVTLPDVVITESAVGALNVGASNYITIAAPSSQLTTTWDVTSASVKAYKADGTDVTTTIFGTATVAPTVCTTPATGTSCIQVLPVTASSTATGPITLKISGVKGTLGSSATGDLLLTVGGSGTNTGVDITSTSSTASTAVASDSGAKVTKATRLKVGSALSSTATIPAATVTGPVTAQTIIGALAPASGDLNVPGQVFVLVQVPSIGFFSLSPSGWTAVKMGTTVSANGTTVYTTGLNSGSVYSVGALGIVNSIPVVGSSADLTALAGSVVYIGYGKNSFDTDAAFNNMISNGTYRIAYTITK